MSLIQQHLKQQRGFQTLEEEVFLGLILVADRMMEPWSRYLKETADLTTVQYNVLRILRGAGSEGIGAGEIGERLIARSPDVTRLIDRLEKRGLVSRRKDGDDRRAVRVFITQDGLDRIAALDQASRQKMADALHHLGRERLESMRSILELVLQRVDPI